MNSALRAKRCTRLAVASPAPGALSVVAAIFQPPLKALIGTEGLCVSNIPDKPLAPKFGPRQRCSIDFYVVDASGGIELPRCAWKLPQNVQGGNLKCRSTGIRRCSIAINLNRIPFGISLCRQHLYPIALLWIIGMRGHAFTMTSLIWRAPFIVLMLAITLLSLVPPAMRPNTAVSHQTEHLLIFALTGMTIALGFRWRWQAQIGALALFAAAIETAQLFVPGRHARLSDLVVNILGAGLGIGLAHLSRRLTRPAPRCGEVAAPDQAPR